MLKAIFFDLDGTLLPFDENEFTKVYFHLLYKKVAPLGYDQKQLIDCIWTGTKMMMCNQGEKTNKEVFWEYFEKVFGKEKLKDQEIFDDFYIHEFASLKGICGENPYAREILDYCKENKLKVILATNPIFPQAGTLTRMDFIGLKETDFDYITTYENSYYSKPNPQYFLDLMQKFGLKNDEVLLFGNNEYEDGEAGKKAGLKVYMVGDYIIPHPNQTMNFPKITMDRVISVIQENLKIEK